MATYSINSGSNKGHPTKRGVLTPSIWERYVDLSDAGGTTDLTSGDVIEVFSFPAGTVVHGAIAEVMTATASSAATFSLGITGTVVYTTAAALDSTGYRFTMVPFEAYVATSADVAAGVLGTPQTQVLTSTDTLDMTLTAPGAVAPTTGLVRVLAWVSDASNSRRQATVAPRDVS